MCIRDRFKTERNGVTYYFLDNEYYFKRRGLYGFYDDGERFEMCIRDSALCICTGRSSL